jgi:hypothetical protein
MAVCRNTVKNPSQRNKEGTNGTKYITLWFFLKNILIPNVAEKYFLILVEENKNNPPLD